MCAHRHPVTRRVFLGAAGAVSATTILPRHVLGGPGGNPPSETITYGVIGNGTRRDGGLRGMKEFEQIAVCDVDKTRIGGEPDNKSRFVDFRKMLERKDIDVVCIATPPHWHAVMCITAAQAGKDIFCEKPMTKFIAEGRAVVEAVNRYGVVFQIGTFGRFKANREMHKLVKSGLLKDLKGVVDSAVKKPEIAGSRTVSVKDLSPEDRRRFDALPDPPKLVPFVEAVRTRQQAGGDAETSHRASTALNLANIAIRLGRTIRWDPVAERVVGDDDANRFVDIPLRAPWHLQVLESRRFQD